MKTKFHNKAQAYDKYRWDYAPEAIDFIRETSGRDPIMAEIGAGTGIFTKHFVSSAKLLYGVEPDANMFALLNSHLGKQEGVILLNSYSHDLKEIPDESVDTVMAAHAAHWFDFEPTLAEFGRILKPEGFVFFIRNRPDDEKELGEATENLIEKYRRDEPGGGQFPDLSRYFAPKSKKEAAFPFYQEQDSDAFLGSLESASFMPSRGDGDFPAFAADAKEIFGRFSEGEIRRDRVITTVTMGKLNRPG